MIELLAASFPVVIRYFMLKRRGEAITLWNMKTALFMWLAMAFAMFILIFYFHAKSYSGILPFRTISVIAQAGGPVTEILVSNGQHVEAGDVLYRVDNKSQLAAIAKAEAVFAELDAADAKARDSLRLAEISVEESDARLQQVRADLADAERLLQRDAISRTSVEQKRLEATVAESQLASAEVNLKLSRTELEQSIPAKRASAEAALAAAKTELAKTDVRTYSDGVVTQLALSVGSPAARIAMNPAMIIIPDRNSEQQPVQLVAGFSQVANNVVYKGMPAEIACDSSAKLSFRNAVFPARAVSVQPAIANGQVIPGAALRDAETLAQRGSLLVYFELVHAEHEARLLKGSGCFVQTYTNNISGAFGHVISAVGIVKAIGLRLKVWGVLLAGIGLGGFGGGH